MDAGGGEAGQVMPAVGVTDADHGQLDRGQALFEGVQGGDVGDQIDQRPARGGRRSRRLVDRSGEPVEHPGPTS
jgi:hypothetical protein